MLIIFSYCHKDLEQALKLTGWIKELGAGKNHSLLPIRDSRAEEIPGFDQIFGKVYPEIIVTDDYNSWPDAPNEMFCKAARHIQFNQKEPWLFLEPDAILLQPDGFDKIEAEYKRVKRPFMGAFVPKFHDSPDHMSGIAVYPGELVNYAGPMLLSTGTGIAFDLIAADTVLAQANLTDLIQRHPQPITFTSREQMRNEITSECVLYHPDKTGSLIDLLRGVEHSEKTEASRSPESVSMSRKALPKEGERKGDLVFRNGGWRKEPLPPDSTCIRCGQTHQFGATHCKDGFNLETLSANEVIPKQTGTFHSVKCTCPNQCAFHLPASKSTDFGSDELRAKMASEKPLSAPWKNKIASQKEVDHYCAALAMFCGAPRYTHLVRQSLKKAGVIK